MTRISGAVAVFASLAAGVALGITAPRPALAAPADYFRITVVDDQTGRGVPLVELRTVNEIRFYTDSAGIAAIGDPDLLGQTIYFHVSSPGYEYPADNFKYHGLALKVTAGGSATIRLHRTNIAERLYRITGGGIYRDSVLTGQPTPIAQPLLNGLVFGQDTVEVAPYQGKLYWFYGDTNRPSYPLGQFATSGATSLPPASGGLDPAVGIDLTYWIDNDGFSKKMIPLPNATGPTWVGGLFTLGQGADEHLYTHYVIVDHSMRPTVSGLAVFDDATAQFRSIHAFPLGEPLIPEGHPFFATVGGKRDIYFPSIGVFPLIRTTADLAHVQDPAQFEAFTCLAPGARFHGADTRLDRDAAGRLLWGWKLDTAPLDQEQEQTLIKAGKIRPEDALLQLRDMETGHTVRAPGGSVYWNPYRRRWIMITTEAFGHPSYLGEVWFAEADTPVGPWTYARHIVTHDHYTFYNPTQHPFFDQDGGRTIFFEGTYVDTFSDVKDLTPRYNYNQLMYRLSLADSRLALPAPVYQTTDAAGKAQWHMREQLAATGPGANAMIPFYAVPSARAHDGLVALSRTADGRLQAGGNGDALFYALPTASAAGENASPDVAPLYEFHDSATGAFTYSTATNQPGATRSETPICRVWRNPSAVTTLDWESQPAP